MTHPIAHSLELVAERKSDLTPLVYARLFDEYPQMKPLFWRDTKDAIKGEMLARVFELILDFIGDNRYAAHLVQCEVITHEGYDVPPDVFRIFFRVVADSVREALGSDWTAEFERAWAQLLDELDYYVLHPDQHAASTG